MTLRTWLEQAPFTLSLTSGFFGFYCHLGFMKALLEAGYSPAKYRGCSAGSIVAAALASGQSIGDLEDTITSLRRKDFWDPSIGIGLLKGEKFFSLLQGQMKSSFELLEKPLVVSVFDIKALRTRAISSGGLPTAIHGSCAVPMMFQPAKLGQQRLWDGGIFDPLAIHEIDHNERILIHDISGKSLLGLSPKASHLKNLRQVSLIGIPGSGPTKMHLGPEIIAISYQKTKQALAR